MADSTVTFEQLLRAYERAIVARVQLSEFTSWGGAITDGFHRTIEEHRKLEAAYVEAVLLHRRARGSGPLP